MVKVTKEVGYPEGGKKYKGSPENVGKDPSCRGIWGYYIGYAKNINESQNFDFEICGIICDACCDALCCTCAPQSMARCAPWIYGKRTRSCK